MTYRPAKLSANAVADGNDSAIEYDDADGGGWEMVERVDIETAEDDASYVERCYDRADQFIRDISAENGNGTRNK